MSKEEATRDLKRALELDKQWRQAFEGLDPEDLHILCAVVSIAAWELRGYAHKVDELRQSEIIAAYIATMRGISDYPLAGME